MTATYRTAHALSSERTAAAAPRRAFTLIELLMVILLVGALAALLLVAINAALRRAKDAAVQTEIDQMATAVETYKSERGAYPLMASPETLYDTGPLAHSQRLMRHVAKAFPRYTGSVDQLIQDVSDGTLYHEKANFDVDPPQGLQIGSMDAAESLVFWLGGFPDPESETKLIGFRKDPSNPFRFYSWPPMGYPSDQSDANIQNNYLKNRSAPLFQFDPQRLVDRDGDGWWEYIPDGTADGDMAPYVYFDPTTYNLRPFYPPRNPLLPEVNAVSWGTAVPYATFDTQKQFDAGSPTAKILWANSQKFQIIAPGRDGNYGRKIPSALTNNTYFAANPTLSDMEDINHEVRLLPNCAQLKAANGQEPDPLPDSELDNLTNFTTSNLGAEKE